jgi:catechol 2,3-dioxygenase-like lactoylglutathione lyase family enzyme
MKPLTGHLTINVSDLDQSIVFYESIGFVLKERWGKYYAQLAAEGIRIGLHPTSPDHIAGNSGNVSIGFASDDLHEAKQVLDSAGITFSERKEEGGRFVHFSDPDGTALYFRGDK